MNSPVNHDFAQLTFHGGGLELTFNPHTGTPCAISLDKEVPVVWADTSCRVTVRDDLLCRRFDDRDLEDVRVQTVDAGVNVRKRYRAAPWTLHEQYRFTPETVAWDARVELPDGAFRSCAISLSVPWPTQGLRRHRLKVWAPKAGMPADLCRMSDTLLEHGEVTSGIAFPAVTAYEPKEGVGVCLCVPFDLQTPRAGFKIGMRTHGVEAVFDWLALSPERPAQAALLLRATGGDWRPTFGWLVERYPEYFEPRSENAWDHWGGTVAGNFRLPQDEARACADLGLAWYEIHRHFQAYGNYHPEGLAEWPSGETCRHDEYVRLGPVTVETIRRTIETLHGVNVAAMMYLQVGHDGDPERLPARFVAEKATDADGRDITTWPGTIILNSDPANPFGHDITRQIDGMVDRYPEMDGVFLDQACYNFPDFAHDDGVTAIDNRSCYMTGLTYKPHLEHLSRLLHPKKVIIGNGPFSIHVMKYLDALIVEVEDWLIDQFQYYAPSKPMFFLLARTNHSQEVIERMFQRCLLFGAGFTSYAHAMPYKPLYDAYMPLIARLRHRRWVFDPNPLELSPGLQGNIFRGPDTNLLVPLLHTPPPALSRGSLKATVRVNTPDASRAGKVLLHEPGGDVRELPHRGEGHTLVFQVPHATTAALAEILTHDH